jgi:molybdopterin-binding protein
VARIHVDGLMAEVVVRIGDQQLVSVITRSSAERLGLKAGVPVFAIVKATEVMIGRAGTEA